MPRRASVVPQAAKWVPRTANERWLEAKRCVTREEDAEWNYSKAGVLLKASTDSDSARK